VPHQEAAQVISAVTNLAFQRLKLLRARRQLWGLLHVVKPVEHFLYLPGVIGILTGQTRTHHVDAPFRYTLSLEHHR
jgi:hypothetical protein